MSSMYLWAELLAKEQAKGLDSNADDTEESVPASNLIRPAAVNRFLADVDLSSEHG